MGIRLWVDHLFGLIDLGRFARGSLRHDWLIRRVGEGNLRRYLWTTTPKDPMRGRESSRNRWHHPLIRVQRITTAAEARAEQVLRRGLSGTGWTVALKLPIQVVLHKEAARLTREEFSLYTRGHFDFTVYGEDDHEPAFAVEFDGFGHERPRQVQRDIIKNRLCAKANLALLRIGLEHVTQE